MPSESEEDQSEGDHEFFIEIDPTQRYGRYDELLGSGAVKKVYRAFDQEEGIEVAWNKVKLSKFINDSAMTERLYSEVRLLKSLKNKNIIALHNVWRDEERNTLNFMTEVCTSGNLREYRKKHKNVSMKALKKWSFQILKGLEYLHTHEPCVIHRDLNCSNVFVNGNLGQVLIIILERVNIKRIDFYLGYVPKISPTWNLYESVVKIVFFVYITTTDCGDKHLSYCF